MEEWIEEARIRDMHIYVSWRQSGTNDCEISDMLQDNILLSKRNKSASGTSAESGHTQRFKIPEFMMDEACRPAELGPVFCCTNCIILCSRDRTGLNDPLA